MYGIDRNVPMNGNWRKNVITTGKKSLQGRQVGQIYKREFSLPMNVPEQVEESKSLHEHSDEGPFAKHKNDTAKEAYCPSQLLLPSEEIESFLRTDDEGQTGHEENLRKTTQSMPAISTRSQVKLTFPNAKRAPSKKSMTPMSINKLPNTVRPTPISLYSKVRSLSLPIPMALTLSVSQPHRCTSWPVLPAVVAGERTRWRQSPVNPSSHDLQLRGTSYAKLQTLSAAENQVPKEQVSPK